MPSTDHTRRRRTTQVASAALAVTVLLAVAVYALASPVAPRDDARSTTARAAALASPPSRLLTIRAKVARHTVLRGATVTYGVRIARGGVLIRTGGPTRRRRAARVWLSVATRLPTGVTASFEPRATRSSATRLMIHTTPRARLGTYRIRLNARGRLRPVRRHRMRHAGTTVTLVVTGPARRAFTIRGTTDGLLAPGVRAPVDLRFTNPHSFSLRVARLTVRVAGIRTLQSSARRPCTAADFTVAQAAAAAWFVVPASSTRSLSTLGLPRARWPQVVMRDRAVNQDGCKHARLTLRFAGIAIAGHR